MSRSRVEILKDIGSAKESTEQRRVGRVSKKTKLLEENNRETKEISRAVMRHPDSEVIQQLEFTRQRMAEEFGKMSDEALTWLLGGSSEMSRGGFQDSSTKTAAQKFREFLEADPGTIPPQKLITGIETIGTAMGYRAIHASWVEPPFTAETPDQKLMDDKIQEVMKDKLTRPIGDIYTARGKDDIAKELLKPNPSYEGSIITGEQEDVSSASENEEEDQLPRKSLDSRKFRSEVRKGFPSWIGAAVDGGIEIRGHTSGTCPLTLAAIDGLCSSGKGPGSTWLDEKSNFESLAGALTVAPFQRGDYHSIAETAAGVNHYLIERAIKKGEDIENTPLQPYDAFKYGMSMLVKASSNDKALQTDNLSIREAIQEQSEAVISRTKKIDSKMKEYNPEKPEEFYEDLPKKTRAFKSKLVETISHKEKDYEDGYEADVEKSSRSSRFSGFKERMKQTCKERQVDLDDGYEADNDRPSY
ncbi:hypothetical protein [Legionella sainthelensi]|uniref:hypothetical protein n=1 Tax=Legionella sainthelensi TaxID=28087 RepID=UPI000E1FECF2|nr:hypothetical protein [Legionella sainthelensi]